MKRYIYFLVPILALGGLIAWRYHENKLAKAQQTKAAQARKNAPPNVRVASAVVRDIVHTFEGVGSVEAPFNVRISPKVTGRLDYLQLREGDHVTAGEVVARIDPSEIQATVNQQQAALAEAQFRLTQAELTTNPTNVQVTTQIRQQQAALTSAEANSNQTSTNYAAQVASAQSAVTAAQGTVDSATATIANAQASIESAQASLNNAQVLYNRTYDLYKQGFVAAQDVDNARTQRDVAQSALKVAQGQLNSAIAARNSAQAQLNAAQNQANIVAVKGKADIAAAQATVKQARAALAYARSNTVQRPAYQANLAALRSTVAAAQAQLRNAQAQLSDTILRSSVSGFVTARYYDPGTVVTAGQAILNVQAIRQVYVTTSVPEDVSRSIYNGQSANIVFDALPGRTYVGKITQVNPAADPQSRQFVVRATLDNAQDQIKPGMFARMTLVMQTTRNAIVVPREAVQNGPQGQIVVVIDSSQVAHVRPVQTGDQDATGIAITSGVQPGENVVILSGQPVKDGQKVKIDTGGKAQGAPGQPVIEGGGGGVPTGNTIQPGQGGANAPTYNAPATGTGSQPPNSNPAAPGNSGVNNGTNMGAGPNANGGGAPLPNNTNGTPGTTTPTMPNMPAVPGQGTQGSTPGQPGTGYTFPGSSPNSGGSTAPNPGTSTGSALPSPGNPASPSTGSGTGTPGTRGGSSTGSAGSTSGGTGSGGGH